MNDSSVRRTPEVRQRTYDERKANELFAVRSQFVRSLLANKRQTNCSPFVRCSTEVRQRTIDRRTNGERLVCRSPEVGQRTSKRVASNRTMIESFARRSPEVRQRPSERVVSKRTAIARRRVNERVANAQQKFSFAASPAFASICSSQTLEKCKQNIDKFATISGHIKLLIL